VTKQFESDKHINVTQELVVLDERK